MSVKRVWAVLLAVVIGVPVFSPALGAEGTAFVDIGPGDWFAPYVEVCVESGMMSGTGEGRFSPGRVLTTAELLAVSARLDQYLTTGSGVLEQAPEDFFAQAPEVRELLPGWFLDAGWHMTDSLGWEVDEESLLTTTREEAEAALALPATRQVLAELVYEVIWGQDREEELGMEAINEVDYLPDTAGVEALVLCRAGILTGIDEEGTFAGERSLTRGELAAVLARVLREDLRVRFAPTPKMEWENFSLTEVPVPEGYRVYVPGFRQGDDFGYGAGSGYVYVCTEDEEERREGLIRAEGSWAVEPEWASLYSLCPDGFVFADGPQGEPCFVGVDGGQVRPRGRARDVGYRHDGVFLFEEWTEAGTTVCRAYGADGELISELPRGVRLAEAEGRIAWQDPESGLWGFCDLQGKVVIPARYGDVKEFCGGLAAVEVDGRWGFVDREGNMVIQPRFVRDAERRSGCELQFCEGLAVVPQRQEDGTTLYGVIDREGEEVLPFRYEKLGRISDGMAAYWRSGETGYVDLSSGEEVPVEFRGNWETGNPFSGGLAVLATVEGGRQVCGYIDRTGNWAVPPLFDHVGAIRNGEAVVYLNGKPYLLKLGRREDQ